MDYNDEDYRVVVNVCVFHIFSERRRDKAIHVRRGLI